MIHPETTTPANPAQGVSDEMVEAACDAAYRVLNAREGVIFTGIEKRPVPPAIQEWMRAALTAAIGSGGQAVAEPVAYMTEGYGYKRVFLEREAADKLARGGDGEVIPLFTHPASSGQDADVETIARVVDPAAWMDDLPVPTRADTIQFHERRQASCETARRILSTLSNPPAQPGWRDMASAPKDGTDILAWSKDDERVECIRYELYDDETAEEAGELGYWRYTEDLIADVAEAQEKGFSHWMPLPAAPLPRGAK